MQLYKIEESVMKRIGFKAQMSELEIYGAKAVINELHEEEILPCDTDGFGLAYTSSSDYGMLNVCGANVEYNGENDVISHFAVLNDGRLFMVTNDNGENATYYIVE